jgi:hypothetical protein
MFGKYSSMVEAEIACREWKDKGSVLYRANPSPLTKRLELDDCSKYRSNPDGYISCIHANNAASAVNTNQEYANMLNTVSTRRCDHERETRQFLGFEGSFVRTLSTKYIGDQVGTWKIRKRFRY